MGPAAHSALDTHEPRWREETAGSSADDAEFIDLFNGQGVVPYGPCLTGGRRLSSTAWTTRAGSLSIQRFGSVKPCVRGTRITVGDVLSYLASGMREDEILADFPQLTRDDIRACLAFAAERERRVMSSPAA